MYFLCLAEKELIAHWVSCHQLVKMAARNSQVEFVSHVVSGALGNIIWNNWVDEGRVLGGCGVLIPGWMIPGTI